MSTPYSLIVHEVAIQQSDHNYALDTLYVCENPRLEILPNEPRSNEPIEDEELSAALDAFLNEGGGAQQFNPRSLA